MEFSFKTVSFGQFLEVMGQVEALDLYREVPFHNYGYGKLAALFHRYCLIGGIPDIVNAYASDTRIASLTPLYDRHLERLFDQAASCASTRKTAERLVQVYQDSFPFAATRVTFRGFSEPGFRSREVGNAFRMLNGMGLLKLIHPTTRTTLPWVTDTGRSPRIQLPDTGLVNYYTGIQDALAGQEDLSAVFNRQISLHIVAQELMHSGGEADKRTGGQAVKRPSGQADKRTSGTSEIGESGVREGTAVHFWVRDKSQSSAEVDFVIEYQEMMIPVEVKRGEPGRLRSLHQFVEAASHPFAVRLYAGPLTVSEARTTAGKTFYLMSLPYFLAGKIREHLEGFIRFVGR